MDKLNFLVDKALSRRGFLAGAGSVAAATALAGCSDNTAVPNPTIPSLPAVTDADVLNFALNLEYLEASFYLYAATGSGLSSSDTTAGSASPYVTPGTVTTNSTVTKVAGTTAAQQAIINEIAYEEQEHVRFLRAALGNNAIPIPNIDLTFFGPLAVAAGILTSSQPAFNPFASFDAFLVGAFIFEDVGVTAYLGAAPLISSAGVTSGYLTAASGILAVEAYHAGYIRTALTGRAINAAAAGTSYPYVGYANSVAALRASLTVGNSGAPITASQIQQGTSVGNTGAAGSASSVEVALTVPTSTSTPSTIVAASPSNALAFARTVNQVHHIVYGSATVGANKGGFFPSGTNSRFATTTA